MSKLENKTKKQIHSNMHIWVLTKVQKTAEDNLLNKSAGATGHSQPPPTKKKKKRKKLKPNITAL